MQNLIPTSLEYREARAEKVSCLVWLAVILATYAFFILGFSDSVSDTLVTNITILVLVMAPAFAGIVLLIQKGYYSPSLKYINTFLQVTLVSAAVGLDYMAQGPAYALSSMPPMAYALVPMITAFRLQPLLGLFAGLVAGLEFLFLYLFLIQPDAELVAQIPSLGFDVTMMKVVILIALGVASALAARSLKNYFINYGKSLELQTRMERSFGRFVSPEIVQRINDSEDGIIESEVQKAAILFGDIRGFTTFSSQHDAKLTTRLINDFFEIVCKCVEEEGGMVNKFMGDGYMALFGVYSDTEPCCESATRAAIRIRDESNQLLSPYGLSAGAAANYGEIITGEVGSTGRCEFTAIGQPVNLASRLEGLNSILGTSILVSQEFMQKIPADKFEVKFRGEQQIKGLDTPVNVYEIV
jgi:adenylate cyclase